jgi:CRP-like cAMP-binding protein
MIDKSFDDVISSLFLFKNVERSAIDSLTDSLRPEFKTFDAGEVIYSPAEFKTKMGFVLSGSCAVERQRADGVSIPLNQLTVGDAFGVIGVFSDSGEFPTFVVAKKETTILFFDKDDVLYLVKNEPQIALNIINFMGDRIAFLNNKISTYSADNTEQKVAKYLMYEAKKQGCASFVFNCKKTSEALNIGRASLYRAIDSLTRSGIVILENKIINITDLEGLERITK